MRRRLAAAAVAAALPCAGLLVAPTAAQADGCGPYAWAQVGYTYADGQARPDGVPTHDASQGEDVLDSSPGCQDFAEPMDVRYETLQDASVVHTVRVTLDSSLAPFDCAVSFDGQPLTLTLVDGVPTTGEVPVDVSAYGLSFQPTPVAVDCGDQGIFSISLGMTVIGAPDQTQVTLEAPTSRAAAAVHGRLVSRRTHRGVAGQMIRIRRHGLRVGTAYTGRHGYYRWTPVVPVAGLRAVYRSTVRHLGSHARAH